MSRIFTQQYQVVKDFKKALEKLNEREDRKQEQPAAVKNLRKVLEDMGLNPGDLGGDNLRPQYNRVPKSTLINAGEVLEQILERRAEIEELEEAAKRTSQQVSSPCRSPVQALIRLSAAPRSSCAETAASEHYRGENGTQARGSQHPPRPLHYAFHNCHHFLSAVEFFYLHIWDEQ